MCDFSTILLILFREAGFWHSRFFLIKKLALPHMALENIIFEQKLNVGA